MKMKHQEVYQLLKYRRQELHSRLQSIKNDFSVREDMDDVLFTIAHDTKLELANVKVALDEIESETFGNCKNCGQAIDQETLYQNPLTRCCRQCAKKE